MLASWSPRWSPCSLGGAEAGWSLTGILSVTFHGIAPEPCALLGRPRKAGATLPGLPLTTLTRL